MTAAVLKGFGCRPVVAIDAHTERHSAAAGLYWRAADRRLCCLSQTRQSEARRRVGYAFVAEAVSRKSRAEPKVC
jgi:hypothetical protein